MIPLNFYRDDEYVYYNNPNGITKKMTIAEFESVMSGTGGESQGVDYLYPVTISYDDTTGLYSVDKSYNEILGALNAGKYVIGIGFYEGLIASRYFDYLQSITYIQFLYHFLDNTNPSSPRIGLEGLQIAPNGTVEYIAST